MLRTQQQNNVLLMQIADQKANILIGLTAIVLTLILCKLNSDSLSVPLLLFFGFSVLAALFALLALLPRITKSKPATMRENNSGLLYFRYLSRISKQDFLSQMNDMLVDDKQIYNAIVGDIYCQGKVLEKKYRYLRISYQLYAFGIAAAVLLWFVQYLEVLEPVK